MFESIINFFKRIGKAESKEAGGSKDKAKERLHLVLMQDRAHVSADFLELMKQEIIDVIKKYIEIEEGEIDVRLTNELKEDGTTGAPSLYANIPIVNIRNDMKKEVVEENKGNNKKADENEEKKEVVEEKVEHEQEDEELAQENDADENKEDEVEDEIIIEEDEDEKADENEEKEEVEKEVEKPKAKPKANTKRAPAKKKTAKKK